MRLMKFFVLMVLAATGVRASSLTSPECIPPLRRLSVTLGFRDSWPEGHVIARFDPGLLSVPQIRVEPRRYENGALVYHILTDITPVADEHRLSDLRGVRFDLPIGLHEYVFAVDNIGADPERSIRFSLQPSHDATAETVFPAALAGATLPSLGGRIGFSVISELDLQAKIAGLASANEIGINSPIVRAGVFKSDLDGYSFSRHGRITSRPSPQSMPGFERILGVHTLDNSLTFYGVLVNSQNIPCIAIFYWDANLNKLRFYVPRAGNAFDRVSNRFYSRFIESSASHTFVDDGFRAYGVRRAVPSPVYATTLINTAISPRAILHELKTHFAANP